MSKTEPKLERLRRLGMLNPNPQQIKAPWFLSGEFFDPNDMVQAKYEMLRHVQVDGVSKVEAAALFGMSPAERARLKIAPPEEKQSAADKFRSRKRG